MFVHVLPLTSKIFSPKFRENCDDACVPDAHGIKNIGFNITKNMKRPKLLCLKFSKTTIFSDNPEFSILSLKA